MSYKYRFSAEAEDDIFEAYVWYEQKRQGLGNDFLDNIESASITIVKSPEMYQLRYKKTVRAFPIQRFPYLILYIVERKDVNIISIFNTNRNPSIWKKRIKI